MLEGERPLGPRARRARRPGGRAASRSRRATNAAIRSSSSSLTAGYHAATGARSGGRGSVEVDELEQPVHGVADLGRRQPAAPAPRPGALAQAGDPLGVVAVRAALEERERRVGELANAVERRAARHRRELGQPPAVARAGAGGSASKRLSWPSSRPRPARRLGRRGALAAVDADEERGAAALELERRPRSPPSSGSQSSLREHPADRRVAPLADGARDEQPVDRPRHRDVVEAQPLGPVGLPLGRRAPRRSRTRRGARPRSGARP